MASALGLWSNGPGLGPDWIYCVVFLGQHLTLSIFSPPRSINGQWWLNCLGNLTEYWIVACSGYHSIQGVVEVLLAASFYKLELSTIGPNWLYFSTDKNLMVHLKTKTIEIVLFVYYSWKKHFKGSANHELLCVFYIEWVEIWFPTCCCYY